MSALLITSVGSAAIESKSRCVTGICLGAFAENIAVVCFRFCVVGVVCTRGRGVWYPDVIAGVGR